MDEGLGVVVIGVEVVRRRLGRIDVRWTRAVYDGDGGTGFLMTSPLFSLDFSPSSSTRASPVPFSSSCASPSSFRVGTFTSSLNSVKRSFKRVNKPIC